MVLTADNSNKARRRALALGARDIVTKPFDVFEFALRVANLIESRIMFEQAKEQRSVKSARRERDLLPDCSFIQETRQGRQGLVPAVGIEPTT